MSATFDRLRRFTRRHFGHTASIRHGADMKLAADAAADMLEKISIALAVFGADQHLLSSNAHYAALWGLADDWLSTHPTQSDVLDRLREARLLPEQRDFASWKKHNLEHFKRTIQLHEELWHLPNGRSLRVVSQPHLLGGIFVTYEDVSEVFALKASNSALAAVQKATLDSIEDAVAIFKPDGRLTQSNHAFAKLWCLPDEELLSGPHFKRLASLCRGYGDCECIWDLIAAAVASQDFGIFDEWNEITRCDGKVLSLAPTRLPNGSTMISFLDLTEIERFGVRHSDKAHTAA